MVVTIRSLGLNGVAGYVRGDCCFKLSKTQEASYLAGNGVPKEETSANVNYLMTTLDKVNLRAAATKDSEAKFNVAQGTVMAYKTSSTVGGSLWGLLGFRLIFTLAAGALINAFYPALKRFAGTDREVSHEDTVDQCR